MIFDKTTMLQRRSPETLLPKQMDHGVDNKVELQVETPKSLEIIEVETVNEVAVELHRK